MDVTAVIQIGNSDDKLTQRKWCEFCNQLKYTAVNFGDVHFSGGPETCAEWQNYCVVIELDSGKVDRLRMDVRQLAKHYQQDSYALTLGKTEFVS